MGSRSAGQIGRVGEALFDAFAAAQGWVVAEPRVDDAPFDRLLWRSHLEPILRVQIKSTSATHRQQFRIKSSTSTYTSSLFDSLALVDINTAEIWMIPWRGEVTTKRYVTPETEMGEHKVWCGWMLPADGNRQEITERTRKDDGIAASMLEQLNESLRDAGVKRKA